MKIRLDGITKEYANKGAVVKALDRISLEFDGAELVLITGENGCGKSTLLNIIGGLDSPTSGKVIVGEKENGGLRERAQNTAYIFQTSNLIATLTVRQNIALVAGNDSAKVEEAIEKTGLNGLADRMPQELSIGQQQRVCIARAIVKDDPILLADEPTSSLDPEMRKEIAAMLTALSQDRLVIVVTHYPEDFEKVDRHIVMSGGKIISDERSDSVKPCKEKKKTVKTSGKAIFDSTFARTKKHALRFAINLFMLFIGLVCIVINDCVFSYLSDDNKVYRQVLAGDEILVTSSDFSALGGKVKKIYGKYGWQDFSEKISDKNTEFLNEIESDYYKVYYNYTPYFMDIDDIGDKKLVAGRMPQQKDEIVINKYLADFYIRYYEKEKLNSYADVIEKAVFTAYDYGVPVQQNPVFRIVGIIDDDLSAYESLKSSNVSSIYVTMPEKTDDKQSEEVATLYYEFIEWLNVGGGAVYAIDCGVEHKSVNSYYNGQINWADKKLNMSAKSGAGIINYDFSGADWLKDVEIVGSLDGAVVNFDSISDISYDELCQKYENAEDVQREINYVLEKNKGKTLYFSMEYMVLKKYASSIQEMADPFKKTYYLSVEMPITGVYIPDDSYFYSDGIFTQGGSANIRNSVLFLNGENYNSLNKLYNIPPDCGLALLDTSGCNSSADVKKLIADNKSILEFKYQGEYLLSKSGDVIGTVNAVALGVGAAMLLFSLIFILYSLSQYFKQHSSDLGILMSLGKSKGYCALFLLGEYMLMIAIALILTIPALFAVPAILNAIVSGVSMKLNVFVASGVAYLYAIAYAAVVVILALAGVLFGISRKTPVERIVDRM